MSFPGPLINPILFPRILLKQIIQTVFWLLVICLLKFHLEDINWCPLIFCIILGTFFLAVWLSQGREHLQYLLLPLVARLETRHPEMCLLLHWLSGTFRSSPAIHYSNWPLNWNFIGFHHGCASCSGFNYHLGGGGMLFNNVPFCPIV